MMDLIDRQAAIKALEETKQSDPFDRYEYQNIGIDWSIDAIAALPSAQPGWIPCSERPPKVREWVLCQCRAGIMDVLRLTEDGNWNKNYPHVEYMSGFVIAWMPLPEPWERGQDDG